MTKIRVLYIISGIDLGQKSGGAEMHAVNVARILDKGKFLPTIYCMWRYDSPNERAWIDKLQKEGIPVYGLLRPGNNRLVDLFGNLKQLWQLAINHPPLVIHSHTENADFMNAILHEFNPSHPVSIRTVHIEEQWRTHQVIGKIFIESAMPISTSAETAVSASIRDSLDTRLLARLTKRQAILIHNGIDEGLFNRSNSGGPTPVQSKNLPGSSPRICIIGRLTEQKGHVYLFDAMRILIQSIPAHLLVIGAGPLEKDLRDYSSELVLNDFIHFLGPRSDILEILPQMDIFVLPSLWEGFPTVIIEAMSQGIPVIASDVSGSRELIIDGKTGRLVPPKNPDAIVNAIIDLLDKSESRQAMISAAYTHAEQFTIQRAAKEYSELYLSLYKKKQAKNR